MSDSGDFDAVRCALHADRILTVCFDTPAKPVNTLSAAAWVGLEAAIDRIEAERPMGIVFASAKPRSFIAGADLFELDNLSDAALEEHLARGQRILDRIAALPMPTVAAINGDALGGGLEVALACRYRIAAADPRAKLGLPETTLGLVPGWGGTFRLPRLVGLETALTLMVHGRSIPPTEAAALGLVDRIVPQADVLVAAKQLLLTPPDPHTPGRDDDMATVRDICNRFRHSIHERSGDHLPAPLRLIDIVEAGCEHGHDAASVAERRGLIDMRRSPAGRNLLRLFFLRTAAKKVAAADAAGHARTVRSAVVIGGGTMGAGIAAALAAAGVTVHVVETEERAAWAASERLASMPDGGGVHVGTTWETVAAADLIVEAVIEDLRVKQDVFRRLDALARPDAILATNTSSLSVRALAAATRTPRRVIGLHFFNPVARMPLVEVVRTAESAPDAVATGVVVATMLGKAPVMCRDAPGFVVNRVLFPYLREAILMVEEGIDIDSLDAGVRAWGLPMGPCALIDEIGIDVAISIFRSLEAALGGRFAAPPMLGAAAERGWLGRKSGRGLSTHSAAGRPVASGQGVPVGEEVVERRLIAPMADEARRVLSDGVVACADAIDLATVLGIGFPAFRGGLASYAGLGHGAA